MRAMEVVMKGRETAARAEPRARRSCNASGMNVRCAEAQADGVPCAELASDCDCCVHGLLAVWRHDRWEELPAAASGTQLR